MADVKDISPDLDKLDIQIDEVEDALQPLLSNLTELSSQLPLLDRAKLFSLTAYSIETLLFCTLKISDPNAQSQAVLTELKRIQQYFVKIDAAEKPADQAPGPQRSTTVNQEAVARILKADLADNKNIRNKLAEKIAEERAKALLKSMEKGKKRPAEDPPLHSTGSGGDSQTSEKKKKHGKSDKRKGKKK